MRSKDSRIINGTRISVFALATGLAAAIASEGALAMLSAEDLDRAVSHSGPAGVHAVSPGKPGRVILEQDARNEPLGYSVVGGPVGRLPGNDGDERG